MHRGAWRRRAVVIAMVVASTLAVGVALMMLALPRGGTLPTTWADSDGILWMLDRLAGAGLVFAGVAGLWTVGTRAVGWLAMSAGITWLAPSLIGATQASDLWRSIGLVLAPLLLPATVALIVRTTSATGGSARVRAWVRAVAVASVAITVIRVATYSPWDDPRCWTMCPPTHNELLGWSDAAGVYRGMTLVWGLVSMVAWAWLAAWCVRRSRVGPEQAAPGSGSARSTPASPRLLLAGGLGLAVGSLVWVGAATLLRADPPSPDAGGPVLMIAWLSRAVGTLLIAVGVAGVVRASIERGRERRRAVEALTAMPAPGTLRQALADALGDPTLTLSYVVDDASRFVDVDGRDVAPPTARPGRATTMIERVGTPIAVVDHDAALSGPILVQEIGAAARLAVDNERLRAAILARVADLRASQERIVTVADEERRRLERDLHDGAQQRLLALSFEIRVARGAAEQAGAQDLAATLARADELAQVAIAELRGLAHGIFPAILRDTGLAPALATLADDAPLPLQLELRFRGRCPEPTEVAAYLVVADALRQATRAGADHLVVGLEREGGTLVIEVEHDGAAQPDAGARIADRVGALGGRLVPGVGLRDTGPRLRVELPCV